MKGVYIDLANKKQLLALVTESTVLASISIDDHKDEAALIEALDKVVQQSNLTLSDITHIACVIGPGGFTTLRVGVAMANALSYSLNIPSVGMHASDVWKERVKGKDVLWLHSTRKTQLFVRGFGSFAKKWDEPTLILLDEAEEELQNCAFVGDLIPEHIEALNAQSIEEEILPLNDVLPSFLSSLTYENQTLLPWYGREA